MGRMCYSAQIKASYAKFRRKFPDIRIDLSEFVKVYVPGFDTPTDLLSLPNVPKAVEGWFDSPQTAEEEQIHDVIAARRALLTAKLETDLFAQRKRLADANRKLAEKHTKTAAESARVSQANEVRLRDRLDAIHRPEPHPDDERIFPGWYAPVMVWEDGQRVVKPMRYQLRPPGADPSFDRDKRGTYNARRDNLTGFWRRQFGYTHGVMVATAFFEWVERDGQKVELRFEPQPQQDMLVACLWARWTAPGQPDLLSFAAITDEPPAEVAAAGHDRCIIPIKPKHVDAWLRPNPRDLASLQAILDDRPRPYYEHRLAA